MERKDSEQISMKLSNCISTTYSLIKRIFEEIRVLVPQTQITPESQPGVKPESISKKTQDFLDVFDQVVAESKQALGGFRMALAAKLLKAPDPVDYIEEHNKSVEKSMQIFDEVDKLLLS